MGQQHPEVPNEEPAAPTPDRLISRADRDTLIEIIDGVEEMCGRAQAAVPSNMPMPTELLEMLVVMSDTVEAGRRYRAELQQATTDEDRIAHLDFEVDQGE